MNPRQPGSGQPADPAGPDHFQAVLEQLALDYGCRPEDFGQDRNVVLPARDLPGQRRFRPQGNFLKVAGTGSNLVVACQPELLDWARDYFQALEPGSLALASTFRDLDRALAVHGQQVRHLAQFYLPAAGAGPAAAIGAGSPQDASTSDCPGQAVRLELLSGPDLAGLRGLPGFAHALPASQNSARPDVLAVAAWQNQRLVGLAGASADAARLWQIGVDVAPDCRRQGLGRCLVARLSQEIQARGKTPYYGTSCSNLASGQTARAAGFTLAWLELYSD